MSSEPEIEGIPTRIGAYQIVAELGRGGMGVVYEAVDPRLERRVALKTLSAELPQDAEWSSRFQREARLLATLNHPNVATIFSLEQEGDLQFLTMELITGRSLEELIRAGVLGLSEALSIGRQIARGLEAAHAAGVIHRDLKPPNVMITAESHAKLLDFGLATRIEGGDPETRRGRWPQSDQVADAAADATRLVAEVGRVGSGSGPRRSTASTGAGTPGYMSPEQIRGEELDSRTDLWALGCVLYESLAGVRAFPGASPRERLRAALQTTPDLTLLPARTPPEVRKLIRDCLEPDRERRLAEARCARELLDGALQGRSWERSEGENAGTTSTGSDAPRPHNLPSELTPLVGRKHEIGQVRELLDRSRLVTLTGVGGCGKTRLAVRVGHRSLAAYADGVWMVDLAPVSSGAGVPRAIAAALGIVESATTSASDAVQAHLAPQEALLILDNCEHQVEATAEIVARLLAAAPRLRVLATSREVLGLAGEALFPVPPLQSPPVTGEEDAPVSFESRAAADAVQLFAQRAGQARADFRLDPINIDLVSEICRRLEGIPLAIELAAARIKVLSLEEIARRLDDRFRLLRGNLRSAVPHHQTLEALIDWSHAGLTSSEQTLFRRLALFRGGWTLDAAESVCSGGGLDAWEILDVMTRLIEKSLVVFLPAPGSASEEQGGPVVSGEPRYRMLETVREYAWTRLRDSDDAAEATARFLEHFAALAEVAAKSLTGPEQRHWLSRLDAEIDNLRAAGAHALDRPDPLPALRLTGPMLRYWMIRARWREGREALERTIARPGAEAHAGAFVTALNALGSCCFQLNDLDAAAAHYQRAVELVRGTEVWKQAGPPLINLGNVYRVKGELDRAAAFLLESLDCFEESDQWMRGSVNTNLGGIALTRERYDEAREFLAAAAGAFRALGDRIHLSLTLMNLGLVAYRQQRYEEARQCLQESAATSEELGDRNLGTTARVNLAIVLLEMGEREAAARDFGLVLRRARETGHLENVVAAIEGLAQLAWLRQDSARSARLAGAAEAIREQHGLVRHAVDQRAWDGELASNAREVGVELHHRLQAEGRALPLEAAIDLALEGVPEGGSGRSSR